MEKERAASGLPEGHPACQICGSTEFLYSCSTCSDTWYCCRDHQRQDWELHKTKCRGILRQTSRAAEEEQEVSSSTGTTTHDDQAKEGDSANTTDSAGEKHTRNMYKPHKRVPVTEQPTSTVTGEQKASTSTRTFTHSDQSAGSVCYTANTTDSAGEKHARNVHMPHKRVPVTQQQTLTAAEEQRASTSTCTTDQAREGDTVSTTDTAGAQRVSTGDRGSANVIYMPASETSTARVTARELGSGAKPKTPSLSTADQASFQRQHSSEQESAIAGGSGESVPLDLRVTRQNVPSLAGARAQSHENEILERQSRCNISGDYIASCLRRYGICVLDAFLGEKLCDSVLNEARLIYSSGLMRGGQLMANATVNGVPVPPDRIRGDLVAWRNGDEPFTENIRKFLDYLDLVVRRCARYLPNYNIAERSSALVSCFPGRTVGYIEHVDNPAQDGRLITAIYYPNRDWDVNVDGGQLEIHPEGRNEIAKIDPKFDRLVLFWSDRRNSNKTLPTIRQMYAITVWYYNEEERVRSLLRLADQDPLLREWKG